MSKVNTIMDDNPIAVERGIVSGLYRDADPELKQVLSDFYRFKPDTVFVLMNNKVIDQNFTFIETFSLTDVEHFGVDFAVLNNSKSILGPNGEFLGYETKYPELQYGLMLHHGLNKALLSKFIGLKHSICKAENSPEELAVKLNAVEIGFNSFNIVVKNIL